ncbi:MAG: DNA mismatch repair protein MutS [Bacteroidota bacterium]
MKQYNQIKAKHPEALLLFRVGDFYETFGADAIKTSKILGIILTKRGAGSSSEIELAGFPYHSLDNYLPKLIRAGQRVAICEQLEDPKMTKTIVKRGVTELLSPGVSLNDQVLDQKKNNFLCAIHRCKKNTGIAFLDISTGEFLLTEGSDEYIDKLIQSFRPAEILFQKNKAQEINDFIPEKCASFRLEEWVFMEDYANEILNKHFETKSLKGFGIEELEAGIIAAGVVMHYLNENQHQRLKHITSIARIEEERYVWLDKFTIRNLELVFSPHERSTTLIDILDHTKTPMGGRLMRRWVMLPLKDLQPVQERSNAVADIVKGIKEGKELSSTLREIGDIERLISKIAVGKVNPKEVMYLKRSLLLMEPLKEFTKQFTSKLISKISDQINPCQTLIDLISDCLVDDPAVQINKGEVIRSSFDQELNELRSLLQNSKDYLENLRLSEIERTGITNLKIAFNNVFGYYIEVTNSHKDKVPAEWHRKQTLTGAERYITEELKVYESKILSAEDSIQAIEVRIFNNLILQMLDYIQPLQLNANIIAQLDCLNSFAEIAILNNYAQPQLNEGTKIDIKNGRHPVIEKQLKDGELYVANDLYLDNEQQQIMMITGPNMSGKSAVLRQTALICLMAQMGSFVPADAAEIGLLDKVFTRVGASDNISSGESTFMVEMNETASILNNLSDRSLILFDEIGRGTSTYDGISIAWSIAEFLHENKKYKPKTLFATHYHELNEMCNRFERIHNFNVSVKEIGAKILFTRKLVPGGSEHSFGIHVAKLAGMPSEVVQRAEEILVVLEQENELTRHQSTAKKSKNTKGNSGESPMQMSFFQLNDPVLEQIHDELVSIDINTLTPVEALMKLNEIKKLTGG